MDQLHPSRDGIRTRRTDSALFKRIAPGAAFLSQMIVREPRAGQSAATAAYTLGVRMAVRRLPPGYRTMRVA